MQHLLARATQLACPLVLPHHHHHSSSSSCFRTLPSPGRSLLSSPSAASAGAHCWAAHRLCARAATSSTLLMPPPAARRPPQAPPSRVQSPFSQPPRPWQGLVCGGAGRTALDTPAGHPPPAPHPPGPQQQPFPACSRSSTTRLRRGRRLARRQRGAMAVARAVAVQVRTCVGRAARRRCCCCCCLPAAPQRTRAVLTEEMRRRTKNEEKEKKRENNIKAVSAPESVGSASGRDGRERMMLDYGVLLGFPATDISSFSSHDGLR